MAHPKNTTAPSRAQHPPRSKKLGVLTGFTYYEIQILLREEQMRLRLPGLQSEGLALELKSILGPVFPSEEIRIAWVAGVEEEREEFLIADSRFADMIISVRSAERPGHELLARLGLWGAYQNLAPQKPGSMERGAGGSV
ncbi:hypothetical protein ACIPZC_24285 [Pseudomonas sp. NPDC089743]|uniref:hypothetical protein n=1 Tax=Pseudomonas sp. NPDC089743 TaxID=3364471 RepID=UPI0037FCC947